MECGWGGEGEQELPELPMSWSILSDCLIYNIWLPSPGLPKGVPSPKSVGTRPPWLRQHLHRWSQNYRLQTASSISQAVVARWQLKASGKGGCFGVPQPSMADPGSCLVFPVGSQNS